MLKTLSILYGERDKKKNQEVKNKQIIDICI